jgi:arsenite methyltransferase
MSRPAGSYGIDAPYVPLGFLGGAVVSIVLSLVGNRLTWLVVALFFIVLAAIYLRTSLSGKFAIWRRLIAAADLRGDEHAVDVGCGRGAVTVIVAEHLPNGRVDGIDLWKSMDQSGNAEDHTRANLEANGVAGRVELHTGDMRDLPFADDSVDLVTASLSIHNLTDPADRKTAVTAAYRILKPGGRIIIADIRATKEYRTTLTELGARDVVMRNAGFDGWWSAPWQATTTLVAVKA